MSTLTVNCGRRDAWRTVVWLVWSLVRHPRSSVTFEVGDDR